MVANVTGPNADILSKIVSVNFPLNQYYQEETTKKQIFLHHTVGGPNALNVYNGWATDNQGHVATCMVVDGNGVPYQGYSSKYWAYHLGLKSEVFTMHNLKVINLDKTSIALEICNYGGLVKKSDNKWHTVYNTIIPDDQVELYPDGFRGFYAFHKYTDEQIETVRQLLLYWCDRYNIPKTYNEDMWDIGVNALSCVPGIYTHVSVRYDKSDLYRCERMISMLQNLSK